MYPHRQYKYIICKPFIPLSLTSHTLEGKTLLMSADAFMTTPDRGVPSRSGQYDNDNEQEEHCA